MRRLTKRSSSVKLLSGDHALQGIRCYVVHQVHHALNLVIIILFNAFWAVFVLLLGRKVIFSRETPFGGSYLSPKLHHFFYKKTSFKALGVPPKRIDSAVGVSQGFPYPLRHN